jgi:hypothetical protein
MAEVPGGDSHRCDECEIDFARSSDAARHRQGVHYTASPGIRAAIERLRKEDRKILEMLGDT